MLVRSTVIKNYYNYLLPNLDGYVMLYDIFPFVAFIAFGLMIYSIYRYNAMETYYKNKDIHISKSIDTATLGMRAFTHAIKNHIQAIKSETEFLQTKLEHDDEANYSLNLIMHSCSQCFDSLENANKKLKNIQLNMHPLPLDTPVQNVLDQIKTKQSHIKISYHYDSNMPMSYIDDIYLTEVLYNIINNAMEAIGCDPEGRIMIEIENQSGWGIISIMDNGPGISEDHLSKVFDPFFSTKASVNNWGIGLSFCHKIVTAHDGNISVESKPSKGTTFKIALPVI